MSLFHPRTQPSFNTLIIINQQGLAAAAPAPPPPSPSTSTPTHSIFAFIVTVFVSFVQIKFPQTQTSSPFETHHTTIMVFFASLILYCSSLWATKRFPSHAYVFHVTMRSVGLLALASLLSLLLPGSCHRVPYMLLVFYFTGECFQLLRMPCQLTHRSGSGIRHSRRRAVLPLTFMDLPPIN